MFGEHHRNRWQSLAASETPTVVATPSVASSEPEPIVVELILITGSRSGLAATILDGYYMIGRHADCQIRPKTRSVSRRHCVVFRDNETFRVLDLESTSGTKINHVRIEPRIWCELNDGDELSCGKICFQVSIKSTQVSPARRHEEARAEATPVGAAAGAESNGDLMPGDRLVTGEAWQEFDVAAFLESQDDADREERYDKIRRSQTASDVSKNDQATVEIDAELDLDGEFGHSDDTASDSDDGVETTESVGPSDRSAKNMRGQTIPKPRLLPTRNIGSRLQNLFSGDVDRMKLIGAMIAAVVITGFVAYQLIEFTNGPPAQVIDDLD